MERYLVEGDDANQIDPIRTLSVIARQLCYGLPSQNIATLGPQGTSSELAAKFVLSNLPREFSAHMGVRLFDTFEAAATSVLDKSCSLLLVANAYERINHFYMNNRLRVLETFIHVTPNYGIAARVPVDTTRSYRLATFPAVVPMIPDLLPHGLRIHETIMAMSTSDAARRVVAGEVELAVTNESSIRENGLFFISKVRPIRMVWTLFGTNHQRDVAAAVFQAAEPQLASILQDAK